MGWDDVVTFIGAAVIIICFALLLAVALAVLRKTHAAEIYLIWYIHSFFFIVFTALHFYSYDKHFFVYQVCGSYEESCKSIYDYLTNTRGEIELVVILTSLAILPQLLAYLLSGLSGTGTAPRFINQTQTIAIWSLVKFFAGLGGILAGEFLGRVIWHSMYWTPAPAPTIPDFIPPFFVTTIAFVIAATHVYFSETFPKWRDAHSRLFSPFSTLHQFLTRYDSGRS
ncbi:hypothetical protein [Bradyrhizobium yuanmingense]|uniref:hypothetical protein n=1 Tax=Bradyrhizobium yuanmingense TaxID=108015 RepID=UPI0023B9499F|nr:hypothetical protein [Bradyrhizobium yuanmingense]MDF0584741.1 hypothetical protein [Bradyrhizobium yuanmingense]